MKKILRFCLPKRRKIKKFTFYLLPAGVYDLRLAFNASKPIP